MKEDDLKLDNFEQELLDSIDAEQWIEAKDIEKERQRMKKYAQNIQNNNTALRT